MFAFNFQLQSIISLVIVSYANSCNENLNCSQSLDNVGRTVFNCNDICLSEFPLTKIPKRTKVLLFHSCALQELSLCIAIAWEKLRFWIWLTTELCTWKMILSKI